MSRRDRSSAAEQQAVTARLAELAARYRRELAGVAAVVEESAEELGGMTVDVVPDRAGSVRMNWIDFGDAGDVQVQVEGEGGAVFEGLPRDLAGVDIVEAIVDAVVDGRVKELVGAGRSRVEVTLAGGVVTHVTTYSGWHWLLPAPGWRRTARVVDYLPYREG